MLERQLLVVMMGFLPGFGSAYLAFNVCGVLLWFRSKRWPFEGFIATLVRRTRSPFRGQKICRALVSRMLPLLAWRFQCKLRGSSTSWRRPKDLVLVQHTWTADSKFTLCVFLSTQFTFIYQRQPLVDIPTTFGTCDVLGSKSQCESRIAAAATTASSLPRHPPTPGVLFSACQLPWGVPLMFI